MIACAALADGLSGPSHGCGASSKKDPEAATKPSDTARNLNPKLLNPKLAHNEASPSFCHQSSVVKFRESAARGDSDSSWLFSADSR